MVARRVSAVVPSTLGDVTRAPLSGRVCLVTGATGGIGRAVVEALAGRDALVVATGRDEGALADLRKLRDEKLLRPLAGLGYRQYPRLREEVNSLLGSVTRPVSRPTDAQALRHTELIGETSQVQQELNTIVTGRIAKLNELLKNLPHVITGGIIM